MASGSVNIVRPDLGLNSLTKIKRMAALAETHYVAIAPFHDGGPIGAMAGIHLNAALINAYAAGYSGARRPIAMPPCAPRSPPGNKEIGEKASSR